jgi:hypothetical protein
MLGGFLKQLTEGASAQLPEHLLQSFGTVPPRPASLVRMKLNSSL